MSAHLGFSEVVPYCASKGAVLAMTRALAVEWAQDNITVNSIAPGWFRSKNERAGGGRSPGAENSEPDAAARLR